METLPLPPVAQTPACRVDTRVDAGVALALRAATRPRSQPQARTTTTTCSPIFARRCFTCHSDGEMRNGLSLETYAGVMKGGASGDVVDPGRAGLQPALPSGRARKEGVAAACRSASPSIPDAEIALIRDWIQQGLLENATSQPKGPIGPEPRLQAHRLSTSPPARPRCRNRSPAVALPEPARAASGDRARRQSLGAAAGRRRSRAHLSLRSRQALRARRTAVPRRHSLCPALQPRRRHAARGRRHAACRSGKVVLFDVQDRQAPRDRRPGNGHRARGRPQRRWQTGRARRPGRSSSRSTPSPTASWLYQIKRHTDWITAIEFSPDGSRLATGDRSGGIYLWESATGGIVVQPRRAQGFRHLAELARRRPAARLRLRRRPDHPLERERWLPGGHASPRPISPKAAPGTLRQHRQAACSACSSLPDGRLVSVGRDSHHSHLDERRQTERRQRAGAALLTKVAASYDSKLTIAGDYEGRILHLGRAENHCHGGVPRAGGPSPLVESGGRV